MAAGDLKSDDCVVITGVISAATTKGEVMVKTQGVTTWAPATDGSKGKFGVALEAGPLGSETIRICIWGPVEVGSTAVAIPKGVYVIPTGAGLVAEGLTQSILETTIIDTICGVAMTAGAAAGGAGMVIWVGMM